jgi:cytochrome c oxidase subunit 2
MADGSGNGRVTVAGAVLGGMLLILIVVSLWLFTSDRYWFTPLASAEGGAIDRIFVIVLVVTGIAFVLVQGVMAYFVVRFGERGEEKATYWHDHPKGEAILIGITAITLTVLVFLGQSVWADIFFADPPEDAMIVQVTGQQFQWVIHYPGPDGVFGNRDLTRVTATNYIGLDRSDPAAVDDIMTLNQMHAIKDQPVRVRVGSTDVIHNFHIPQMRVKQDAVPGMAIELWFTPIESGEYEIACAELCGLGHYRMKGFLTVDETEEEFQQWLEEQIEFQPGDD